MFIRIFFAISHFPFVFADSPYFCINILSMGGPYVLSVKDCFRVMSLAMHGSSKLRDLNNGNFCIEIVPCILTTLDVDVMFEFPPCQSQWSFCLDARNGHET